MVSLECPFSPTIVSDSCPLFPSLWLLDAGLERPSHQPHDSVRPPQGDPVFSGSTGSISACVVGARPTLMLVLVLVLL